MRLYGCLLQMYKANANPITFSQSTTQVMDKLNAHSSGPTTADRPGTLLVAHALQVAPQALSGLGGLAKTLFLYNM